MKRNPAVYRSISSIKRQDKRVRVLGTVVNFDKNEGWLMIDNGTGIMEIIFDDEKWLSNLKVGMIVRVFGRPIFQAEQVSMRGELLQDFSGVDVDLYKKVLEVMQDV